MKASSTDHPHDHHPMSEADRAKITEGAVRLATRPTSPNRKHRHAGRARTLDHGIGDHPAIRMSGAGLEVAPTALHSHAVPKVVEHIRRRAASDDIV